MIYLDLEGEAGREWLNAHKPKRKRTSLEAMPREFLEREVAQWMLRDKEVHTGRDLGAKPKTLSFHKITQAAASDLPANDAKPIDGGARVAMAYVQDEALKCVTLWRAVIEQQAYDLLKMWGASKEDHRSARMFFESETDRWRDARDGVCAMALIEPESLLAAHKAGRLKQLADNAIGRDRWHTRMINQQATTAQPDLFYSMGMR